MEIASPSIKEAVAQCVQKGCTEVIVAPYFLSQGRHIQQDIPALVAEAAEEHPDLRCIIADPIGDTPNDRGTSSSACTLQTRGYRDGQIAVQISKLPFLNAPYISFCRESGQNGEAF